MKILNEWPDDRVRCLAFAAQARFNSGDVELANHLLDRAVHFASDMPVPEIPEGEE